MYLLFNEFLSAADMYQLCVEILGFEIDSDQICKPVPFWMCSYILSRTHPLTHPLTYPTPPAHTKTYTLIRQNTLVQTTTHPLTPIQAHAKTYRMHTHPISCIYRHTNLVINLLCAVLLLFQHVKRVSLGRDVLLPVTVKIPVIF